MSENQSPTDTELLECMLEEFRIMSCDMGSNHVWSYAHHHRLRGPSARIAVERMWVEKQKSRGINNS